MINIEESSCSPRIFKIQCCGTGADTFGIPRREGKRGGKWKRGGKKGGIEEILKSYILVEDTLKALQNLSSFIRKQTKAKVIAITGSNGKTTVKEMVAHILSDFKVSYTKGNLNNHIGVPLTLLSIKQDDEYVVVEIGANNLGEIGPLAELVNPDVAAVTNIGYAHIEGFGTLENTAKEKYSIFKYIYLFHFKNLFCFRSDC